WEIREALDAALAQASVVIVSGGTGLSPTDVTIETIAPLFQKELDGFGEIFRSLSYQDIGTSAIMSRATAGVIEGKLVVCLPGSPKAVRLAMEEILLAELGHIVEQLSGRPHGHG
ncbi:MAG: molybdenum cofactor biosynthesis protein B, partial [Thermoplasmata archaeon]